MRWVLRGPTWQWGRLYREILLRIGNSEPTNKTKRGSQPELLEHPRRFVTNVDLPEAPVSADFDKICALASHFLGILECRFHYGGTTIL